ncbi:MAG: class II aldolase/adducin family protein [Campylobacterota bacterium]|nr:class II aldolase/adducin family protein [Campylobacterota bacterium]
MQNNFDVSYASTLKNPLAMRVYTSQLLGREEDLVLHGGGNTSVKIDNVLHVKGSGWNLDTIKEAGFSPVDLDVLIKMATREHLSDTQMVAEQREALKNPEAPNPSIEAILHAIIPFDFVDHTHADAVVSISNTPDGKERISKLYGENMLIIDYIMPGFILAKSVYEQTKDLEWDKLDGIILMNHGVFTFDNDAKVAYDKMIDIVSKAENYLKENAKYSLACAAKNEETDPFMLETLQKKISSLRGCDIQVSVITSAEACTLSKHPELKRIIHSGGLTPEHVIRIKPFAAIFDEDFLEGLFNFTKAYQDYYVTHASSQHQRLDLAPRYGFIKGVGVAIFAKDDKEAKIMTDIVNHTINAMLQAEAMDSWTSLSPSELFEMEYWELEQNKLRKTK